eukprot:m.37110 g.37110  ORF g.37110 m.37110 type:complete len:66 (+) comp10069_c0_seq1:744-941(+)
MTKLAKTVTYLPQEEDSPSQDMCDEEQRTPERSQRTPKRSHRCKREPDALDLVERLEFEHCINSV